MDKPTHLWDHIWVRDLALIAGAVGCVWLLYAVRAVTLPALVGFGLAYVFNPVVTGMQRWMRWPRWVTTAALLLMVFTIVVSGLLWLVPSAAAQGSQMVNDLGRFVEKHWKELAPYLAELTPHGAAAEGDRAQMKQVVESLRSMDSQRIGQVILKSLNIGVGLIGSAIGLVAYAALAATIIVYSFFVSSCRYSDIVQWFVPLIPGDIREQTLTVTGKMDRIIAAYIRGRLVQAAIMGVILCVGWRIAGVPYWLLVGLLCAALNLIPYAASLGWVAAVALSVVHALTGDAGLTWGVFVWPSTVYFAAQLLDGFVVEPWLQGQAVDLQPLTVMLAVIAGGMLMGLFGMLLAIPVAASVKILAQEVFLPRWRQYAASRGPGPGPGPG